MAEPAWITVADVKLAAGVAPSSSSDDAWLAQVTAAANGGAVDRRAAAGYEDDATAGAPAPSARVQQGTTLYALGLYRERGTWGQGAPGFEDLGGFEPPGPSLARVRQLLGIPRPVIG